MALKTEKIPLSQTEHFSKLFLKYVSSDNSVKGFYEFEPTVEGFKKAIDKRSNENINRKLLVDVLKKQYDKVAIDSASLNIESLLENKTYTVCTGHQLCLFTGPLYFIYKIISTINLSETLKKQYPEYNFVPVYWMATEDHDFEEIKNIHLFGKNISWNKEATGAVGRLHTDSLASTIDELKIMVGESENSKELIQLFTDAYLRHTNLADATRYLVHQLFGKHKLIIVDGDDPQLKAELSAIIKDDILNGTNYKQISKTISELETKGFKAQVKPREINCFFMRGNSRERIEYEEASGLYKVLNTSFTFTKEELISELNNNPEQFSPNVVLRPLYQQKILPNLAYVGGPGEIAYWLEYRSMFDFHKINFPVNGLCRTVVTY